MIDSMTRDDVLSELGEISKYFEECPKETYVYSHQLFERWMNAADWAAAYLNDTAPTVGGWISVKSRMPAETHSIFWRLIGSKQWTNAMWREQSDEVLVTVSFKDGTRFVTTGRTHDGVWITTISRTLEPVVTHWQAMPEPPKEEE